MALWWFGNAIAFLVIVPLVVVLANRVIAAGVAISRYADDILVHGVGITAALDPLPALEETRAEVNSVTASAVAYVTALKSL